MAAINRLSFAGVSGLLPASPDWLHRLLGAGFYLLGILLLTWVFCRGLDRQSLASLGLQRTGQMRFLAGGLALGSGLVLLVFVVMASAGWLTVAPASPAITPLLASALAFAAISFVEELTFRGYIMQGLAKAWSMPAAVAVSSVLFGLVHLINPNAQVLGVLNICIAGLFFAVAYLVSGSLWLPAGLHIGWNLTEIHILGFPGSGHTEPSLLQSTVRGPELLTGGPFGPEGGLLGLAAWLLGIVLLLGIWRFYERK
jgi:membrane protease YdiL (CAAX protease family)